MLKDTKKGRITHFSCCETLILVSISQSTRIIDLHYQFLFNFAKKTFSLYLGKNCCKVHDRTFHEKWKEFFFLFSQTILNRCFC